MAASVICSIISLPFWIVYICLKTVKILLTNSVLMAAFFFAIAMLMMGVASITAPGPVTNSPNVNPPLEQTAAVSNSIQQNWKAPIIELEDNLLDMKHDEQSDKVLIDKEEDQGLVNDEEIVPRQSDSASDVVPADLPEK